MLHGEAAALATCLAGLHSALSLIKCRHCVESNTFEQGSCMFTLQWAPQIWKLTCS